LPGFQAVREPGFAVCKDRRTTSSVDGTIDTRAAAHRAVGRVHNCIHLLLGDVPAHKLDLHSISLPGREVSTSVSVQASMLEPSRGTYPDAR
jgi:hypothetical protein